MAESAETLIVDNLKPAEDWTVVLPRRRKQRRNSQKIIVSDSVEHNVLWAPSDSESDSDREAKLMHKMQSCIQNLESSGFYRVFLNQMRSLDLTSQFNKVLGSEDKMPIVIYGIGNIELFEPPRMQLSLAVLMKKEFSWIGDVEVFDPIISLTESRILTDFGCSVLSINEQGRRQVSKPMLFFMPHCDAELYDNLLKTNWQINSLNKIVLFGNSFEEYERIRPFCQNPVVADRQKHILALKKFTKEFPIDTVSDCYFRAFHSSSWHFFSLDSEAEVQLC